MTMYPTVRPSLTLDFQKSKQLDPRISFSRSSSATYVEGGVVKYADEHQARFEEEGLLIEETRTNVAPYSDLSSGWSISPAQGNNATAPDGSNDAIELNGGTAGGTGNILATINITAPSAGTYILSFFVKKPSDSIAAFTYLETRSFSGSASGGKLFFDWSTKDWSSYTQSNGSAYILPVEEYANGWFRLSIKSTLDASDLTGSIRAGISDQAGNASTGTFSADNKILLWGAQWEKGAFPSSYIPTAGSEEIRSEDIAQITGDNFSSWYNQSEGTLAVTANTYDNNYTTLPLAFIHQDASNSYQFGYQSQTTYYPRVSGGNYTITVDSSADSRDNCKIAGVYGPNSSGNFTAAVGVNGSSFERASPLVPNVIAATNLKIGSNHGNTLYANTTIARLAYYSERLTNEQLEAITL